MRLTTFLTSFAVLKLAAAYLEPPPTTAAPDTIQDCSYWAVVTSTDTCQELADSNALTLLQFDTYNPSVGTSCKLVVGNSYCVEENYGIPPTTTSSTTTTSPTTTAKPTTSGNGITTPQPIQTGMAANCNAFYLVDGSLFCADIAAKYGVSLANFYAWNPAVGSNCQFLGLNDYVCVGIIGSTPMKTTTTTKPTSTTKGNGISTPTPIQTGMVTSCNTFYLVDGSLFCADIAAKYGITISNFYAWNPAVGTSCQFLGLNDYVCVGIIGSTPIKTTSTTKATTTTSGNGIATPTPIQPGMTTSCKKFHLVVNNDQCGNIATAAGISLANFYSWNPSVGSDCSKLFLGYYVCIGV